MPAAAGRGSTATARRSSNAPAACARPGAAQLERARADGRWEAAYAGQRSAEVPDDLRVALLADPRALEFFDGLDSANRYAILYRIEEAKRPATRAQRIARYVSMLAAGERLHP